MLPEEIFKMVSGNKYTSNVISLTEINFCQVSLLLKYLSSYNIPTH